MEDGSMRVTKKQKVEKKEEEEEPMETEPEKPLTKRERKELKRKEKKQGVDKNEDDDMALLEGSAEEEEPEKKELTPSRFHSKELTIRGKGSAEGGSLQGVSHSDRCEL